MKQNERTDNITGDYDYVTLRIVDKFGQVLEKGYNLNVPSEKNEILKAFLNYLDAKNYNKLEIRKY